MSEPSGSRDLAVLFMFISVPIVACLVPIVARLVPTVACFVTVIREVKLDVINASEGDRDGGMDNKHNEEHIGAREAQPDPRQPPYQSQDKAAEELLQDLLLRQPDGAGPH